MDSRVLSCWSIGTPAAIALLVLGSTTAARAAESPTTTDLAKTRLLTTGHDREFLLEQMVDRDQWKPFPPARDREAWDAIQTAPLHRARKAYLAERAEALLGKPWPVLPATLYMEYARTGNRSHYQAPYFRRRENLSTLALTECLEHRGRFLDEIANGIWTICEESTWCLPAHASRRSGDVLHRLDVEGLDLFACETGMSLAQVHYLLREELDGISPTLCERIREEVGRRIIEPYATGERFGNSGWTNGHNNWSPWCASNVMGAAMYLEEDPQRLADVTFRLMQVVDRFIDGYGEDGGCDEGPGYWSEAGGAMLVFLELLRSRTDGAIDLYEHPKIAAMGRFITYAHMDGPWFANFADADPQTRPHPGKVYRYGDRVGSDAMKDLALLSMRDWRTDGPVDPPIRTSGVSRSVLGPLMELFWIPVDARPRSLPRETVVWLEDLQVLFARQSPEPGHGLVLAAKGGHNAESHNHNDLGHFILFLDGQPGIIDVGRETYTRKTFSSQRYDLWFTRGLGHNAPVVDGVEQHAGRQYRATNVEFQERDSVLHLGMNLEQAYPESAGIRSLRREFEFDRGVDPHLAVRDTLGLARGPAHVQISMYAARPVKTERPGTLQIGCAPRPLLLTYDAERMTATVQAVPVEDDNLREAWGPRLQRITFAWKGPEPTAAYGFTFRAGAAP
ncbi:MAG: heparinase II/III family protein [Pirellulales bacterium]|nr:heparinase II/III family protein [Pirellulales bacterium]